MYEIIYNVNCRDFYTSYHDFLEDWTNDFPDWYAKGLRILIQYEDSMSRRDVIWLDDEKKVEATIIFNSLQEVLDYTRHAYTTFYALQVDKMTYNDVQFKNYLLNTNVDLMDGKYTASVKSIKEIN